MVLAASTSEGSDRANCSGAASRADESMAMED
jgi:hypothetical protein